MIFETLFAAQMTGINRKNGSLRVSLSFATKRQFRSKTLFSQQLRNAFRNCEINVTVLRSGTRVPKSLLQLRNTMWNRIFGAKSGFTTSQCVSQLPNESSCAAKWHSCAKNAFAAAKYPRRDFYSVAEWFCSIVLISQRLRNLAELCFSSVFTLF